MRGGSRPGAGRKSGAPNKASAKRAAKASLDGALPHEMLLAIARGQKVNGHEPTFEQQLEAMARAAPYYAPRFASKVEHTGAGGGPIQFADLRGLTDAQIAALEPVLSALAVQSGASAAASTH